MRPNVRSTPLPNRPLGVLSAAPLALVAAVGLAGCELATDPGDALPQIPDRAADAVPDTLRVRYEEDAARLAVRHLQEAGRPEADSVEIPAAFATSFYNALAAVYALDHPARDSVVERYRIHTSRNPGVHELLVGVDRSSDWTRAWREGRSLTGDPAIDALVQAYGLVLVGYYEFDATGLAVLRAAEALNMPALAGRFERIEGVHYAEENGAIGGTTDIRARPEGLTLRLDYSVGYGDCPAGCMGRHTWSFRVDMDGEADYLGSSGDPAP